MMRTTQADIFQHLRQNAIEGLDDPFERISTYMAGVAEDLASAKDDIGAFRSRTAASDIEDAAMLMGEALAFAYGYKFPDTLGHHFVAIKMLTLYLDCYFPQMHAQSSQLDRLRTYRHKVKYDGEEAPNTTTKMYFDAVSRIFNEIRQEPLRLLSERQTGK